MAFTDIQNKVGQIKMTNMNLIAQARMDPNKTPETDLSGFQEQGGYAPETGDVNLRDVNTDTPVEGKKNFRKVLYPDYKANRRGIRRKKSRFEGLTDDQIRAKIAEEDAQRAREAEEERLDQDPELNKQREDMRQGDYLEDPEQPFNINSLLQIGGKALDLLKFVPQMMIRGNRIAGVPNFPGGGYGSTSGAFVDLSGEAYFLIDGELIPQGGYDPAKHGDLIPHGGPDIPQAMNNTNNSMKIYG